jgi:phosphoribosylanthranilate isomerase
MTFVKICGITNLEDALLSVRFGADMLGFNFYRGSKRYIDPTVAKNIVAALGDAKVLKVGVFVNMESYRIDEFVDMVGLDLVQIHGSEDVEYVRKLRSETSAKIIKAFRVGTEFDSNFVSSPDVDHILLDGDAGSDFGGAGKMFDWSLAAGIDKLILAGGLTPENVADAVQTVRPFAVDVASGVETSPGKKDPEKVAAFIRAAKEAL